MCMSTRHLRVVESGMPTSAAMPRTGMAALRRMHASQTARSLDPSGSLSRFETIEADVTDLMNLLPSGSIPLPGLPRRGRRCPPFRPAAGPLAAAIAALPLGLRGVLSGTLF